jgi:hypothetical protein
LGAALIEKTPAAFSAFADSDDSKPLIFLADWPPRLGHGDLESCGVLNERPMHVSSQGHSGMR